jgi:hypothetical protein
VLVGDPLAASVEPDDLECGVAGHGRRGSHIGNDPSRQTVLVNVPIPSMVMDTVPGRVRKSAEASGRRGARPVPIAVPMETTSPGSSVWYREMNDTTSAVAYR